MCMNCGCGEPEERHHPTDITKEDLERAAQGAGMSVQETAQNMRASLDEVSRSGTGSAQASTRSA